MKKTPSFFYQSFVIAVIATFSALAISITHNITTYARQQSAQSEEQVALNELLGTNFENNLFSDKILISSPDSQEKLSFYPARRNKTIKSFAIKSYSDIARGGRMEIMVGFNIDGSLIGYKILSTPHHLMNIADNDIDTQPSVSANSLAIKDAINRAIGAYKKLNSGGLK